MTEGEWISVKDKLPKKYERVLVTDSKNICLHYKQSMWNWEGGEGEDLYCDCDQNEYSCDIIEGNITHWMELPKPPELPK